MDQARGRDAEGGEPDRDAVGGLDEVRVPQEPDAEAEEDEWEHERDPAEGPGDHRMHQAAELTGQSPPLPGRDDDGQADEEQAEAVAAVRGVEVAGAGADPPGSPTGDMGHAHPDAADSTERQRPPPGPLPVGPPSMRAAPAAGRARGSR